MDNLSYIIAAVRGMIHGFMFAYFLSEKKWVGLIAVLLLVALEVVR